MIIRTAFLSLLIFALVACDVTKAPLAPDYAEPKTRPARNFTSFEAPLRCMDTLFMGSRRPTVRLSSTGIPDHTNEIDVAADDMLINALSRMTRRSHAYVFLDQGLVKANGLIDLLVVDPEDPPRPHYYIRGAISQLDEDTGSQNIDLTLNPINGGGQVVEDQSFGNSKSVSVVTVDLHLVAYPSREVISGSSVSNSMVVRGRGRGFGASGVISLTGFDLSVQVDRIESRGQAVRNLIEVSLIELIGRHSNVPYWRCLSLPETNAWRNSFEERHFNTMTPRERLMEFQADLARLGLLSNWRPGEFDKVTRNAIAAFQAQEDSFVSGTLDFDTYRRLKARLNGTQIAPNTTPLQRLPAPQQNSRVEVEATQPEPEEKSAKNEEPPGLNSGATWRVILPPEAQRTQRLDRNDSNFIDLNQFLNRNP